MLTAGRPPNSHSALHLPASVPVLDVKESSDPGPPRPSDPQPNDSSTEIESLTSLLSQPTNILKRIPRLSRVTAARKLAAIVQQVVSQNDIPSWMRLLSFAKSSLLTLRRGGKCWSLATLVYKQVTQESPEIGTPASQTLGDYRGEVRLTCSEDAIAEHNSETLEAIREKHPPAPLDSSIPALELISSLAFSIDTEVIVKIIGSFPKGSGGDSDGLIPQHLKDLTSPSAGIGSASLLSALVGLITLILEGRTPSCIRPLLFDAKLTALIGVAEFAQSP